MKRNRIIIFIFLLFIAIKCYGQSGLSMSVYGKAIDWNTNMPIKDFEVTLLRIEEGVTKDISSAKTNEEGFYKIRYLVKGNYEFLIELPGIGIIYALNFEGGIYDNFYGFEIREGQNLNLNFTVGSVEIGEIKKEYIATDIINITILYPEDLLYEPVQEEGTLMQRTTSCRVITGKSPVPVTVGDNVNLGKARGDKPAGGRFTPFFKYSNIKLDCENNKCILESINVNISGTIELHSEEWFQKPYGTNCKTIGSCLKECLREHENKHWDDTIEYFKGSFCNSVKELNNHLAKCECYINDPKYYANKCYDDLYDIIMKYRTGYYTYMAPTGTGEDRAYAISDPCCDDCRNKHFDGGQQ
jgi:5-hydroxyisourate hydrolase-like protein (transthyretin family)